MSYQVRLSDRAARDLDHLDRDTQRRILRRLDRLADSPFDTRLSIPLKNADALRRSRVGGWRIIYTVNQTQSGLDVLTIERRSQVYQRI